MKEARVTDKLVALAFLYVNKKRDTFSGTPRYTGTI